MALLVIGAALVSAAEPAAADFGGSLPKGKAYGAVGRLDHSGQPPIVIDPAIEIGQVATQVLPCTARNGQVFTNQVEELDVQSQSGVEVIETGTIVNQGVATFDDTFARVKETSTAQNVDALGGLVRATAIETRSQTTADATGVNKHSPADDYPESPEPSPSASGVKTLGLVINGQTIADGEVAPNTRRDIPGVGYVMLNEQTQLPRRIGGFFSGLEVNGVHVYVTSFLGWSGDFVLTHAESHLRTSSAGLSGDAFASQLRVSPPLTSGRQSVIYLPCAGTQGVERVLTGAGGTIAPGLPGTPYSTLLSNGATRGTVEGRRPTIPTPTSPAYSESSEQVEAARLFVSSSDGSPLVSADLITTMSRTEAVGDVRSTGSVEFVNLVVAGRPPITGSVPPNTEIILDGIGFLRLNEQRCEAEPFTSPAERKSCIAGDYGAITVSAIHIKVTVPGNPAGLDVGADFRVAVAHSDVRI